MARPAKAASAPALRDTERSTERARARDRRAHAGERSRAVPGRVRERARRVHPRGPDDEGARVRRRCRPSARRLRLLTRREYRATVRDLFGDDAPAMACARATDCAFRDTCTAGTCQPTRVRRADVRLRPAGPHARERARRRRLQRLAADDRRRRPRAHLRQRDAAVDRHVRDRRGHRTSTSSSSIEQRVDRRPARAGDAPRWLRRPELDRRCSRARRRRRATTRSRASRRESPGRLSVRHRCATRRSSPPSHVDAYLAAAEKLADFAAADPIDSHACDWTGRTSCGRALVTELGRRMFRRPLDRDELDRYARSSPPAPTRTTASRPRSTRCSCRRTSSIAPSSASPPRRPLPAHRPTRSRPRSAYTFLGTTPTTRAARRRGRGELATRAGIETWARTLLADPRARDQVGELVAAVDRRAERARRRQAPRPVPRLRRRDARCARRPRRARSPRTSCSTARGTFDELMTADYTVARRDRREVLRRHRHRPRRVHRRQRAGLLGHASVLATTAHSDQTSPIRRGLLVRRNLLCQELPPPPPFAGGVPAVDPNATTRERFAMHTQQSACARAVISTSIDVGFGLERFDPVGRWRETENGQPIDASGDMNDVERLGTGTTRRSRRCPSSRARSPSSHAAQSCFVRQYLRFSRGVRETLAERCARLCASRQVRRGGRRHPRADGAERARPRLRGAPMIVAGDDSSSSAARPRRCRSPLLRLARARRARPRREAAHRLLLPRRRAGRVAERRAERCGTPSGGETSSRCRDLLAPLQPYRDRACSSAACRWDPPTAAAIRAARRSCSPRPTAATASRSISASRTTVGASDPFRSLYLGAHGEPEQRVGRQAHLVRRARLHDAARRRSGRRVRARVRRRAARPTGGGGGSADPRTARTRSACSTTRAATSTTLRAQARRHREARSSSSTSRRVREVEQRIKALGGGGGGGDVLVHAAVDRRDRPRCVDALRARAVPADPARADRSDGAGDGVRR